MRRRSNLPEEWPPFTEVFSAQDDATLCGVANPEIHKPVKEKDIPSLSISKAFVDFRQPMERLSN